MKKEVLSLCAVSLSMVSLISCEDIYEGRRNELPEIAVQLKASVVPYGKDKPESPGDKVAIGVYMVASEDSSPLAANLEMSAEADGVVDTSDRLFYPKDGSKVDILSYAPYTSAVGTDGRLQLDVSTAEAACRSDILYAANRNKYLALAPVKVQLKHVLSKVTFDITAGDGMTEQQLDDLKLEISDIPVRADFDLLTGDIVPEAWTARIPVEMERKGHYGSCLAIPCAVANLVVSCSLSGMTFSKKLGPIKFKEGSVCRFDMAIGLPGFDIEVNQIEDWMVEEY